MNICAANESDESVYNLCKNSDFIRLFIWPQLKPKLLTVWKAKIAHKDENGEYIDYDKEEWGEVFPNGRESGAQYGVLHDFGKSEFYKNILEK